MILNLSSDTPPERAETRLWASLTAHPNQATIVHLNGFPVAAWGSIVNRLPGRITPTRLGANTWSLTPTSNGPDGFTASVVSGRFDRPDHLVSADWQRERDAGMSLILGTELAHRNAATLLGTDPRYGLIHHPGQGVGENALEYAKADWEVVKSYTVEALPGGGPGRFSQPASFLVTVLRNRHNGRLFADVQNHDPARPTQSRVNMRRWLQVKQAEVKVVHQLEADHPGIALAVTGDSNAKQSAPWFLRFMAARLPGFRNGGGYEFGAAWVKGLTPHGHTTIQAAGSDHAIRRIGLRWPA